MNNSDYISRITTATPLQLQIITLELAISHIKKINENDKINKHSLNKANALVSELFETLDANHKNFADIAPLYLYISKLIAKYSITKKVQLLDDAIYILNQLLEGFLKLLPEDKGTPIIDYNPHDGANFDYLNEELTNYSNNPSFKA